MKQKLKEVFDKQRELIEKVQEKERALGYNPPRPEEMDLLIRSHQDWMRTLAWFFVEEVGELEWADSETHRQEELSDCLHFIVEIAIFSGLDHECLTTLNILRSLEPIPEAPNIHGAIINLSQAINLLKMKPWKAASQDQLNIRQFQWSISEALFTVIQVCEFSGWDFHQIFMNKNSTNIARTQNGY